jgi:hypothetical protein
MEPLMSPPAATDPPLALTDERFDGSRPNKKSTTPATIKPIPRMYSFIEFPKQD